jgi:hypothetical protein
MIRQRKTEPEVPLDKPHSGVARKRRRPPGRSTKPPPQREPSSRIPTVRPDATTQPAPRRDRAKDDSVRPARQRAPSFADVDEVIADLSKDPRRDE